MVPVRALARRIRACPLENIFPMPISSATWAGSAARVFCQQARPLAANDAEESSMSDDPTIDVRNLQEFFRDSVHTALERQRVTVDDHTEHYVVNVLTMYARSDALFDGDAVIRAAGRRGSDEGEYGEEQKGPDPATA